MKTAGVVLDFNDDPTGRLLKDVFPTAESLPDIIKTAHILSQEERDVLRDDAFALVLQNEGKVLKKFACVDPGNTALSALYFIRTHDLLPQEAIKVAAANLANACEEFGLPGAETMRKIALASNSAILTRHIGGGAALGAAYGGHDRYDRSTKKSGESDERFKYRRLRQTAAGAAKGALVGGAVGGVTGTLHNAHRENRVGEALSDLVGRSKHAAANGMARKRDTMMQGPNVGDESDWASRTNLLSVRGGADSGRVLPTANTMKTAAADGTLTDEDKDYGPKAKRQEGLQQTTPQVRVVDVTGLEPKTRIVKKASTRTALDGRYSLDGYVDVQKAVTYFDDNWTEMAPSDRHEYAVKTAARAGELGIPVSDLLARYGSEGYAPDVESHLANRRTMAPDWADIYSTLQEKRASIDPDTFVDLLEEADRASGLFADWGGGVCDPYLSTFGGGFAKEASLWSWTSRTGDTITEDQLRNFALNARNLMAKHFPADTTDAFCKDPITIFESLPDTHKISIVRLATN